jgi:DNA-binding beta-propeller fold protein YncE
MKLLNIPKGIRRVIRAAAKPNLVLIFLGLQLCASHAQFGKELASFNFGVSDALRDPQRGRVYCAVPALNSVAVIDSDTVKLLATIYCGSSPAGLGISDDGTRLYVANGGSSEEGIAVIDLDLLTCITNYATLDRPGDIAVGLNHRIFVSSGSGIEGYDGHTGARLGSFYEFVYGGGLVVHPDRTKLYYFDTGLSPSSVTRYDISSWPPVSLQSVYRGGNGQDLAISQDGQFLAHCAGGYYAVDKISSADLTQIFGTMTIGAYPRAVTFSPDGTRLFAVHTSGHIDVWNPQTYVSITTIVTTGFNSYPSKLECDRTGKVLLAGDSRLVKAYYIGSSTSTSTNVAATISHAVEIRWDSSPGVLYQIQWKANTGSGEWFNLGGQVLGTGLTLNYFDTTRDNRGKFYRVIVVP